MAGFKIIGEMSKGELIDEILDSQKKVMGDMEVDDLKRHVIDIRVREVQNRLTQEANLEATAIRGILNGEGYL